MANLRPFSQILFSKMDTTHVKNIVIQPDISLNRYASCCQSCSFISVS